MAAHARPRPALAAGTVARRAGATAMIDVSDGLLADVAQLTDQSGVGFELEEVPVAAGATGEEALAGGDDYVLVFTLGPAAPSRSARPSRPPVCRPMAYRRVRGGSVPALSRRCAGAGQSWEHTF